MPAQDFGKRASGLESQRFPSADYATPLNQNFMNQRFATPELSKPMAGFDGRRSRMDARDSRFQERIYPVRAFSPAQVEPREIRMHPQAAATPRINNVDRIRENTLSARYSTERARPYGGIPALRTAEEAPFSLADINRMNFRRGYSQTPGLPVQEAGSGAAR